MLKKRPWYFLMMLTVLAILGIFLHRHTSSPLSPPLVHGFGYGGVQKSLIQPPVVTSPVKATSLLLTPSPTSTRSSGSSDSGTNTTSNGSSPGNPLWSFLTQWLTGQSGPSSDAPPSAIGQLAVGIFQSIFVNPLVDAGHSVVTSTNPSESILWSTPTDMLFTNNTLLTNLWKGFSGAAIAFSSVVLAWNCIKLMMKNSDVGYAEAIEFVPRFIFAVAAALLSLHFVEIVIGLNNALCNDTTDGMNAYFLPIVLSKDLGAKVAELFIGGVYGLMEFLLFITDAMRMGALGILIVTAPLGMLAFASQETETIGRFWLNTFVATTFIQFLQVLIIRVGMTWLLPTLAGINAGGTLAGLATSCAVLALALQVPRMVGQVALQNTMNIGRQMGTIVASSIKIAGMLA